MEKVLWLDDLRDPSQAIHDVWIKALCGDSIQVIWVKNYDEFVEYITSQGMPSTIFFNIT
jgi:hypothetical protein